MYTNSKIEIYTDGGCRCNPGKGAWAFIVLVNGQQVASYSAGLPMTTNNEMELAAILEAERWLEYNAQNCDVTIYSDSSYSVNTMLKWYDGYINSGKADKKKNQALIHDIMALYDLHNRTYKIVWVKGHASNPYNNQADLMVNQTMDNMP